MQLHLYYEEWDDNIAKTISGIDSVRYEFGYLNLHLNTGDVIQAVLSDDYICLYTTEYEKWVLTN